MFAVFFVVQVAGFRQQSADIERGLLLNVLDKLHVRAVHRLGRLSLQSVYPVEVPSLSLSAGDRTVLFFLPASQTHFANVASLFGQERVRWL